MNSRTILLGLLLLVARTSSYACEACGCSMIFWDIGMTPQFEVHQLSMRWQHQAYHSFSSIENKLAAQIGSKEVYQQLDAQFQWRLHQRWRLMTTVPYAFLSRELPTESWQKTGWSDPSLLLQYVVLNPQTNNADQLRCRLTLGLGAKAPWGQASKTSEVATDQANFRLSSGSWDLLTSAQLVLRYKQWGMTNNVVYSRNGTNAADYQYGHRWNAALSFFGLFSTAKSGFMPSVGILREQAAQDVQHHYYRSDTGGNYNLLRTGLQWLRPDYSLSINYDKPIVQNWANGLTEAQSRMAVQLTYFLK